MTHDESTARAWRRHADGTPVHRYTCTIHDGEECDGHCGPTHPADETPVFGVEQSGADSDGWDPDDPYGDVEEYERENGA